MPRISEEHFQDQLQRQRLDAPLKRNVGVNAEFVKAPENHHASQKEPLSREGKNRKKENA